MAPNTIGAGINANTEKAAIDMPTATGLSRFCTALIVIISDPTLVVDVTIFKIPIKTKYRMKLLHSTVLQKPCVRKASPASEFIVSIEMPDRDVKFVAQEHPE